MPSYSHRVDPPFKSEESLFEAALAIPSEEERLLFIERECEGDPEMWEQIQGLLRGYQKGEVPLNRAARRGNW